MYIVMFMLTVILLLCIWYSDSNKSESFNVKYVADNAADTIPHKCMPQTSESSIANYQRNFFTFNDRINQTTHCDDPVDRINLANFDIGTNIASIYDTVVDTKK
jgi:hypothetical protein